MKHFIFSVFGVVLIGIAASCSKQDDIPQEPTQNKSVLTDEEKAVETLTNFIAGLNSDPQTRSTAIGEAKVTSVRKTSTSAYGTTPSTRAGNQGMPVYELTLTNPDNTTGFAVVADPATVNDVVAYAPTGSITDTLFNKSLALYFREFAAISEGIFLPLPTSTDYWQPGWENSIQIAISPEEVYQWLDYKPELYTYRGPVDKRYITSAYVPTKWGQGDPYNNRVPYKRYESNENVVVGCFAVALGQVMAFHKYPSKYNWNLLTASQTIPPTKTILGGLIRQETETQKEVSRLLYDIALAGETTFYILDNAAGTSDYMITTGIDRMGYAVNDNEAPSSLSIKNEIETYRRPVMFMAQSEKGGHIWVIDAILTQERWFYYTFWRTSNSTGEWVSRYGIMRYRVQGNIMHCNWGWSGKSDGWYYIFAPAHRDGTVNFNYGKVLFTGIKPNL